MKHNKYIVDYLWAYHTDAVIVPAGVGRAVRVDSGPADGDVAKATVATVLVSIANIADEITIFLTHAAASTADLAARAMAVTGHAVAVRVNTALFIFRNSTHTKNIVSEC